MLTRRRLGVVALAALSFVPLRRAQAQLFDDDDDDGDDEDPSAGCHSEAQYGDYWTWGTLTSENDGQWGASLTTMVPSLNRARQVKVSYFECYYIGANTFPVFAVHFYPEAGDTVTAYNDVARYELWANQTLIDQATIESGKTDYLLNMGGSPLAQPGQDFQVRLTMAGRTHSWIVNGLQTDRAVTEGRRHLQLAYSNYQQRLCEPKPCLLTTVACGAVGLPDDCFELRMIRRLRDSWLTRQTFGVDLLDWYYAVAPKILSGIPPRRAPWLFRRFYLTRVLPAVAAECVGLHGLAFRWLEAGVRRLAFSLGLE